MFVKRNILKYKLIKTFVVLFKMGLSKQDGGCKM